MWCTSRCSSARSSACPWSGPASPRRPRSIRRQAYKGGFPTREAAERGLADALKSIGADEYVEPSTETLGDFLTKRWLPAMKPPKLEATTWTEYRRKISNQIVPRIGQLRLQRIRPLHLNGFYADLLANGRVDGKGGLSAKTVRECHVILHKPGSTAERDVMVGPPP